MSVYSYGGLVVAVFGRKFVKIHYTSWVFMFVVGAIGTLLYYLAPKLYEAWSVFDSSICIYLLFVCAFHYNEKSREEELSEQ